MKRCPDDGRCHHDCEAGCFRVAYCTPLSAHGEDWTPGEIATHGRYIGADTITEMIVTAP